MLKAIRSFLNPSSLPAIATGVLASCLLIIYVFVVRPRIPTYYEEATSVAIENFKKSKQSIQDGEETSDYEDGEDEVAVLKSKLDYAILCLRRRLQVLPQDPGVSLLLSEMLAESASIVAYQAQTLNRQGQAAESVRLHNIAAGDDRASEELLLRLSKTNSQQAFDARIRLFDEAMTRPMRSPNDFDQLAGYLVAPSVDEELADEFAKRRALLDILRFQSPAMNYEAEERLNEIRSAIETLQGNQELDLFQTSVLAEGLDWVDPERAYATAMRGSQQQFDTRGIRPVDSLSVAATWSCFMRLGYIDEGQGFLEKKLPLLSESEQVTCRQLCSDAIFRQAVTQLSNPKVARRVSWLATLPMAIRLDIDSPWGLDVMQQLVFDESNYKVSEDIVNAYTGGSDNRILSLASAMRKAFRNEDAGAVRDLKASLIVEPNLARLAVASLVEAKKSKHIDDAAAGKFLDLLASLNEADGLVRHAKALYYLVSDRPEAALVILEEAGEEKTGDLSSLALLETVYAKLHRMRDASKVRAKRIELIRSSKAVSSSQ